MDSVHPLRHRQGGLIAFLLVVALCFGSAGAWAAGPKMFFDIPEGDAQDTLPKYSVQSKVGILYLVDTVRGARTHAVVGEFDATEALRRMLEGTNLAYSFQDDRSFVAIKPGAQGPGPGSAEEPKFVNASTQLDSKNQEDLK